MSRRFTLATDQLRRSRAGAGLSSCRYVAVRSETGGGSSERQALLRIGCATNWQQRLVSDPSRRRTGASPLQRIRGSSQPSALLQLNATVVCLGRYTHAIISSRRRVGQHVEQQRLLFTSGIFHTPLGRMRFGITLEISARCHWRVHLRSGSCNRGAYFRNTLSCRSITKIISWSGF